MQNNIIRQLIGLQKFCHMTTILKCLKIFDFDKLHLLENNDLSSALCIDMNNRSRNSQPFGRDIAVLEKYFDIDIELNLAGPDKLK